MAVLLQLASAGRGGGAVPGPWQGRPGLGNKRPQSPPSPQVIPLKVEGGGHHHFIPHSPRRGVRASRRGHALHALKEVSVFILPLRTCLCFTHTFPYSLFPSLPPSSRPAPSPRPPPALLPSGHCYASGGAACSYFLADFIFAVNGEPERKKPA